MYEHCGYFTTGSLKRIFQRAGFDVMNVKEAYQGQFVGLEARPGERASPEVEADELAQMKELVAAFSDRMSTALRE